MAPDPVSRLAPAKINLYLHVTGRRPDGFHLLDSLFAFVDVGDRVEVRATDGEIRLTITGPFAGGLPDAADNLVMKAARSLAQLAGSTRRGADIQLTKSLPVASGLGGGSADAAATLQALNQLWDAGATAQELSVLAERLGADVPACLHTVPIQVSGIGETIRPAVALPACAVVLVNPGMPLLTADVFKAFAAAGPAYSAADPLAGSPGTPDELAAMLRSRRNDLEPAAMRLAPDIAAVLRALTDAPECLLARLSGSGPTCFGLFADTAAAARAARLMAESRPGWWVESGAVMTASAL